MSEVNVLKFESFSTSALLISLFNHLYTLIHEVSVKKDRSFLIIYTKMFFDQADQNFIRQFHYD